MGLMLLCFIFLNTILWQVYLSSEMWVDCSRLHGDEYERVTNKVSRQRIFNKDMFEIIELLELFIAAFVEGSTHQRSDSALPQTFYCKFVLLVFLTEFYFEHANLTEITKRKELKNIKFSYIFLSAERVCLKRSRMKFILFLFLPPFSNVIIYTSILWIQPWLDLSSDGVLWDTLLMQFSNLISFKRGKHFCHQNIITVWLPDSDPYDPCILIFAS